MLQEGYYTPRRRGPTWLDQILAQACPGLHNAIWGFGKPAEPAVRPMCPTWPENTAAGMNGHHETAEERRAEHVGILAAETYFPSVYVRRLSARRWGTDICNCASLPSLHCGALPVCSRAGAGQRGKPYLRGKGPIGRLPACFMVQVKQEELERHDGVPSGKYTVGLGQVRVGAGPAPCSGRRLQQQAGICPGAVSGRVLGTGARRRR